MEKISSFQIVFFVLDSLFNKYILTHCKEIIEFLSLCNVNKD
jgi:hypothetical protein